MDQPAAPAPAILLVLVGAICLLSGYRMVRFSSKLGSALIAIFLGLLIGQQTHNGWVVAAILTAAAVAGWMLGNAYSYVNMAIIGAQMGVIFMFLAALAFGGTIEWSSGIASALLGGMLAVRFERPLVILGTSMAGASMLVQAGHPDHTWGPAVLFVCLSLLGCLFQVRRMKTLPPRRPAPRDP